MRQISDINPVSHLTHSHTCTHSLASLVTFLLFYKYTLYRENRLYTTRWHKLFHRFLYIYHNVNVCWKFLYGTFGIPKGKYQPFSIFLGDFSARSGIIIKSYAYMQSEEISPCKVSCTNAPHSVWTSWSLLVCRDPLHFFHTHGTYTDVYIWCDLKKGINYKWLNRSRPVSISNALMHLSSSLSLLDLSYLRNLNYKVQIYTSSDIYYPVHMKSPKKSPGRNEETSKFRIFNKPSNF